MLLATIELTVFLGRYFFGPQGLLQTADIVKVQCNKITKTTQSVCARITR